MTSGEVVVRRPRRWIKRTAFWAVTAVLLGASTYMGLVALAWSQRVTELREISAQLEADTVAAEAAVDLRSEELGTMNASLEASQELLLVTANHAVQADDIALFVTYTGIGMGYCIEASENVAFYVRTKWTSGDGYPWVATHEYDDDVTKACKKIRKAFTAAVDDLEDELAEAPAAVGVEGATTEEDA